MLIKKELLQTYNKIQIDTENENEVELVNIHIGMAEQIINDYVGFDVSIILEENSTYTESQKSLFKNVELRIATLLQLEDNANIGVSTSGEVGMNRSYLNITDYTQYLKPLSAFRKV